MVPLLPRSSFNFLVLVVSFCMLGGFAATPAQTRPESLTNLLKSNRRLRPAEIARVMDGVRSAMSGKTFRLRGLPAVMLPEAKGPRIEVLMRGDGRPRYFLLEHCCNIRSISEYTGQPARTCDGAALKDELVLDFIWKEDEKRWESSAHEREVFEPDSDYFEMTSRGAVLEDGGIVRGVPASRLFIADYHNRWVVGPSRPPDNLKQTIVIDVASLLPLRWELIDAGNPTDWGVEFLDDPLIMLGRPPSVTVKEWVP